MAEARTIELLLTNGSLTGLLRAELAKWNGVMFSSPRESYLNLSKQAESRYWGIYLLLSENRVYIGQANELLRRIGEHDRAKEWWNRVVLLTTTNDSLTRSDIDWLEHRLIQLSSLNDTLDSDNKVRGNTPKVSVFREANLEDFLDGGLLLLELIGIKVFAKRTIHPKKEKKPVVDIVVQGETPIVSPNGIRDFNKLVGKTFYLKKNKVEIGKTGSIFVESNSRILVKEGSDIFDLHTKNPSAIISGVKMVRDNAQKNGFLNIKKVIRDITFSSINEAATFINGQTINAWTAFKDENGRTIDEIAKSLS